MKEVARGYDFYFVGVNMQGIKGIKPLPFVVGAASAVIAHTASHYVYAGLNGMKIHQDGLSEVVSYGYSRKQYREVSQAGFIGQHLVGFALTSIPCTRHSSFTKGYVSAAFLETATYPLIWRGQEGDLNQSEKDGGNANLEYAGFLAIATHNLLRVNFKGN
jgi:hypothetical protein